MKTTDFIEQLKKNDFDYFATVPCTITAKLHELLETQSDIKLVTTYHEHNLPGFAIGYYLATGKPALIHLQNSGFSNAYDGLLTAVKLYNIPVLILVTWRGDSQSDISEPHQLIGEVTEDLTSSIGFPVFGFKDGSQFQEEMQKAMQSAKNGKPTILRIASNVFESEKAIFKKEISNFSETKIKDKKILTAKNRDEALQIIREKFNKPNTIFLYSNGYTARAAFALFNATNDFYNIGYMGGSLAIGYALALKKPNLNIVIVDGDQNAQMSCMKDHLFSFYPKNLHYYIIDNKIGASVGSAVSVPLADYYKKIANIIEVSPDDVPFTYGRVKPNDGLNSRIAKIISFIKNYE